MYIYLLKNVPVPAVIPAKGPLVESAVAVVKAVCVAAIGSDPLKNIASYIYQPSEETYFLHQNMVSRIFIILIFC